MQHFKQITFEPEDHVPIRGPAMVQTFSCLKETNRCIFKEKRCLVFHLGIISTKCALTHLNSTHPMVAYPISSPYHSPVPSHKCSARIHWLARPFIPPFHHQTLPHRWYLSSSHLMLSSPLPSLLSNPSRIKTQSQTNPECPFPSVCAYCVSPLPMTIVRVRI